MSFPTPVLLGADLNCYQLARLLHENYGVFSYAFGRYPLGETKHSSIVQFCEIPDLWEEKTLLSVLLTFAKEHPRCLLFGCTDAYVHLISKNRALLEQHYLIPYGEEQFYRLASDKLSFGGALERLGIPTPRTRELTKITDLSNVHFPQVVKAANSREYYAHPFHGMKKAYLVKTVQEAEDLYKRIRASGYASAILLQDYIPGDDTAMYVANGYVDEAGNLRQLAIGHVLLQEHTPNGIGNPCAILTERMPILENLVVKLVQNLPIRGLFNLDIRYDHRNKVYNVLECNPRQGRSAYSTVAAGLSPIAAVVDTLVYEKPYTALQTPHYKGYWHSVPDTIIKKHICPALWQEVLACKNAGHHCETLRYAFDLKNNHKRKRYLALHNLSHIKKFYVYDIGRSKGL